jgi:DNA recombination protein RmuC
MFGGEFMEILLILALVLLIILMIFVIMLAYKIKSFPKDLPLYIDAAISKQLLSFQSEIHKELGTTRDEIARSKDIISQYALQTSENIKSMGETLYKLTQQQEEAQKLGQSLKDILQVPKLRGSYGEEVLEELLEEVLPRGVWERQYSIEGKKVDAIVKFKEIIIPIDAKFPREDYIRYLDAQTHEEKLYHWKKYEEAVKKQINEIKEKYIKPEKGTAEFAIMFIPSEATYYETVAQKNYLNEPSKLYEYARKNNVVMASPQTLFAFLQIIIIGMRNWEIVKNVKKLQEGLMNLQRNFDNFMLKYVEIGKSLEKANESYRIGTTHIERYKNQLDSIISIEKENGMDINARN